VIDYGKEIFLLDQDSYRRAAEGDVSRLDRATYAIKRLHLIGAILLSDFSNPPHAGDGWKMGHLRSYLLTRANPKGYWCVRDDEMPVYRGSDYWVVSGDRTRKFMIPTGPVTYARYQERT
jgi:hypothetical protein